MKPLFLIGVMTGTSVDGCDISLAKLASVNGKLSFVPIRYWSSRFPTALRTRVLVAQKGKISIRDNLVLTRDYSEWISSCINSFLKSSKQCKPENTLISIHGQTLWHEPKQNVTLQALDAPLVTVRTGFTVCFNFRSADMAAGGQGAPLVPLFHYLRAKELNYLKPKQWVSIHNLGGISNCTLMKKDRLSTIAFDTGPANVLIDLAVQKHFKGTKTFDSFGKIAANHINKVEWNKLLKLLNHPYIKMDFPKSTGRELFNEAFLKKIPGKGETLITNATAFSALTIAFAYAQLSAKHDITPQKIYFAGGGSKNFTLLALTEKCLIQFLGPNSTPEILVVPDSFGDPQYIEALAFSRLGLEALLGRQVSMNSVTGAKGDFSGCGIFSGKNFQKLLSNIQFTKNFI
jgi:anhydro-N-acetylmuramic acid kinase